MLIQDNGAWKGDDVHVHHHFDSGLCESLKLFFTNNKAKSVCDLGCGLGVYVTELDKSAEFTCSGFDGNPDTPKLTNNKCKVLDLSVPTKLEEQYDWIMSLEVGEHLPMDFEDIYMNNLHINNKYGIVLSWAVEGQGGLGHYNERNNDYIKDKIITLGYINDIEAENYLREASSLFWFKNTIMVFRKC